MKKFLTMILSAFMLFSDTSCSANNDNDPLPEEETEGGNTEVTNEEILIVYFSRKGETYPNMEVLNVGHTANMARYIQEYTGGVLFEIEPEVSYEDPYSSVLERARQEIDNNTRPAIKSLLENLDQYSVVFVGSPIWYGRPPIIM